MITEDGLTRRAYDMERRNAQDNYRRAVDNAGDVLEALKLRLDAGELPMLDDLRRLVADAAEAYQRAAAWQALERVAFMLPKEG